MGDERDGCMDGLMDGWVDACLNGWIISLVDWDPGRRQSYFDYLTVLYILAPVPMKPDCHRVDSQDNFMNLK
jgi:hypothetical protein